MEINNLPAVVQPKAVYSPHPLCASAHRRLFHQPFKTGETVADYLRRNNVYPVKVTNFNLALNDVLLSPDQWEEVTPSNGDLITLRATVHSGGDGGSDPMRTLLTIAVLVASQGTAVGGWAAVMGAGTMGPAMVAIGGMLLINALIPIKTPKLDNTQASTNYSLSGSANTARLFEPLPLVFGKHRMYPDHGAKPFTHFVGDDQVLIQVFNFGLSDLVLTDFKIGDTALSSFDEVATEESIGATGEIKSFPGNIDTIAGGDLVANAGTYIEKTTSLNTTRIGVDISGLNYFVGREEGLTSARVNITIEYREVGSGTWLAFSNAGATLPLTNGTKEMMRRGFVREVTEGQYDVRVMLEDNAWIVGARTQCDDEGLNCTTEETLDARGLNDGGMVQAIQWEQLKSFQPDTADYTGQKRLGLSIKANGQLNGSVDSFNAMVSAKNSVWTGSAWSTQETSNPAWHFLALARGGFDADGRRIWGAGLPDARIDIEEIKLWGAWCDAKGLSCNLIFDMQLNVDDMLNTVAQCGRGASTWSSGKLGVIYDEANKPVTAVFGMSNIIRNTFKINYITGELSDEIIVEFINPDLGYQRDTVSAVVPGVTYPVNPVTIPLLGITNKEQAGKEANLRAAEQLYRRRQISWESDIEGLAVQRGDVAILSHDLTQWDYSGRLVAGTDTVLTLDRDVPFTPSTAHFIGVRLPDGSYDVYDVVYLEGEQNIITITTPLPLSPNADLNNEPMDYLWFFAPQATPGKQVKITDVVPLSQNRVRITATDEEDDYYLSENNSYTYVTPGTYAESLPTISYLSISESLVIVGSGFGSKVTVNWNISGEYGGAFIRAKDANTPYKDMGSTLDRRFEFEWPVNNTVTVEVVAFNLQGKAGDSSKATASLLLVGKKLVPADINLFTAEPVDAGILLTWAPAIDVDLSEYEIRQGATWETSVFVDRCRATTYLYDGDLSSGDKTFWIIAIDTTGNESPNPASALATVGAPDNILVSVVYSGENVVINYSADKGSFPISTYEIRRGTDWASGEVIAENDGTSLLYNVDYLNADFWVKAKDIFGNVSAEGGVSTSVVPPETINLKQEVIDNNVLLRWEKSQGTLPVDNFEIRKGTVYSTAEILQSIDGTFAAFFEIISGTNIYWVTAQDSAGNKGTSKSIAAVVAEPPDFILNVNWASTFSGTKTNALLTEEGSLVYPVNTTETWAEHFTGNSWTTIQDQLTAGYDYYLEPSLTTGSYAEEFDYGTVLASTSIKIIVNRNNIDGAVTLTPNIKVKKLSGDAWSDLGDNWVAYATDFQYVKVTLSITASGGNDLEELIALNVLLDSKLISESGSGTANAADSGGTTVNLTAGKFVDVNSINVTANSTTPITAIYDFTDTPNPTDFKVLLFDKDGVRVSGDFSWTTTGY
ncbi:MAG: phage tail protein [Gammaproteobacteria bacterium]|nr:phage tail protein [Gammaproteobacteria bacterium]